MCTAVPPRWLRLLTALLLLIATLLSPAPAASAAPQALIPSIEAIQQQGELRIGIPPFNTPPFYYSEPGSRQLVGYDIDVARTLASKLGVKAVFDNESQSFNDLVRRAGRGEVDVAIGKLGTTYPRLFNANPHTYMRFHQALLINRRRLSRIGRDQDPELGEKIRQAPLLIGAIQNSAYDTYAKDIFPKAKVVALPDWDAVTEALYSGRVDAVYRDAVEIRMLTLQNPRLALLYAPVMIADQNDIKSIYIGAARSDLGPVVDFLIGDQFGIPDEDKIIRLYPQFFQRRS